MKLEVKDLSFSYIKNHQTSFCLDHLSFSLEEGNIVAILGPNGSGKSTLLKCIQGIEIIQEGQVLLDTLDFLHLPSEERAKKMCYVPQNITFNESTVFDFVLLGRKPYLHWNVSENDLEKTQSILESFHLDSLALRLVSNLSGGERQRAAIARAMVQDGEVILLDEPTSNLDMKSQMEVIHFIKQITQQKKLVLVTMHDINLALRLAHQFMFIKHGKMVAFGTREIITPKLIEEVYETNVEMIEKDGKKWIIPEEEQ